MYYKVKKGDTIWSISEKFKLQSPDSIKSLNNLKKGIHIGQKLKIPIL
ncbi:MAG: LysM peptidoglycan-binding domain-containing protein [Bacteroidota bacterium]|nr:LysM peptidoglycan-binding domain-containing protein [Bacteroidota bacterium]MDP4228608.1 LysM peptidoglycan-binding domain-containing protein [Bacteroidota bacterium]